MKEILQMIAEKRLLKIQRDKSEDDENDIKQNAMKSERHEEQTKRYGLRTRARKFSVITDNVIREVYKMICNIN